MRPHGVLESSLYAEDLDSAERFYRDVIGLEPHSRMAGRHVFFRCGDAMVLIFDPRATREPPTRAGATAVPLHGATGAGHLAFRVAEAELADWRRRFAESGVPIETEVEWPGGGRSIYVRDPAGNSIELATPELWA
jgi:catechol 2,3-dioxygenase-like lactoylglutathione lyase family enzyme